MTTQNGRAFNEWLRAQLKAKKMSQRQLAQQSGVDHSTISRLIRGDRMPSLGTATKLARGMVTKYGMSDELGTMVYADDDAGFGVHNKTISEATQQKVDAEIRRILDVQYDVARSILEDKREIVEAMVAALLEWETIDAEQVKAIMEGRTPNPPAGWVDKGSRIDGGKGGDSTKPAPAIGGPAEQT